MTSGFCDGNDDARFQRCLINNLPAITFFSTSPPSKTNMSPPPTSPTIAEPLPDTLLPPNPAPHPDETLAPEKPSMINLATPAPLPRPSTLTIPNAPAQNPPAKGVPACTPAANATPSAGRRDGDAESGGVKGIDLSEFDPYATTPGPSIAANGKKRDGTVEDEPEPLESLQEKQDANANVRIEQGVDMAPTGSSQDAAARQPSEREQASNRPATPGASTEGDQEASDKDKEPVFNFQGFLKDLKLKSAEPVARYLKRCVLFLLRDRHEY